MVMDYGNSGQMFAGYDENGNPVYINMTGAGQYAGGAGASPDTAAPSGSPVATDLDAAIKANRELYARTEKSGWYKDTDGQWYQSPEYIRALADLDAKYSGLISQKRQSEGAKGRPTDMEPLTDPATGQPFALRDPATGQIVNLPRSSAASSGGGAAIYAAHLSAQTHAAQLEWEREKFAIQQQFEEHKLTLDQAQAKARQAHERISAQLQAQQNEVSQRGQDMNLAGGILSASTSLATAMLPNIVPAGTAQDLADIRQGYVDGKVVNTPARTMSMPFDPESFAAQITARALQGLSPTADAMMANVPQGNGFTLPARVPAPELPPPSFGAEQPAEGMQ